MMKQLILLILFINIGFSQDKVIIPKKGYITFVKQDTIYDKEIYLKSFETQLPNMKEAMKKEIYLERLTNGTKTDTIALNKEVDKSLKMFITMLPILLLEEKEKLLIIHYFKENEIEEVYEKDGEIFKTNFINTITGEKKNENNEFIEMGKSEIKDLKEFKNDTRLINGLKCFKVVYYTNQQDNDKIFDSYGEIFGSIKREIWVTQAIKCSYHPLIDNKEILEKYYPLEIIDYPINIKGSYSISKILSISIE